MKKKIKIATLDMIEDLMSSGSLGDPDLPDLTTEQIEHWKSFAKTHWDSLSPERKASIEKMSVKYQLEDEAEKIKNEIGL